MLYKFKKAANKAESIHIGTKIDMLLNAQRMTKRELGDRIGVSASNAVHLTTRDNVDVRLLQRVGNALKYNFWKHFPIDDGSAAEVDELNKLRQSSAEKDKRIEELEKQLSALQRETEPMKTEMRILKIENEYLRDFTEFVKSSLRPSGMRLRSGRRKSLGSGERLMIEEGK